MSNALAERILFSENENEGLVRRTGQPVNETNFNTYPRYWQIVGQE